MACTEKPIRLLCLGELPSPLHFSVGKSGQCSLLRSCLVTGVKMAVSLEGHQPWPWHTALLVRMTVTVIEGLSRDSGPDCKIR